MNVDKLYDGAKAYLESFLHDYEHDEDLTDAFVSGGKFVLYCLAEKIKALTPDDIDPNMVEL